MIYVNREKGVRFSRDVCLFLGIMVLFFAFFKAENVQSEEHQSQSGWIKELRFGVAAHDVDGLWSGSSKEDGPDFCAEIGFNHELFHLSSVTAYPNAGVNINTRGDTSKVYGGILLEWTPAPTISLSTGLGLALHNGQTDTQATDRKSLGSKVLFRIPIEIGIAVSRHHRIILAFDHISNAYLATPNEGMDTLGLLYAYRF